MSTDSRSEVDVVPPAAGAGAASRWVAIQRNRRSGSGRQHRAVIGLIRELRRLGYVPRLFGRREFLDAELVRRAEQPPVAIVAAGGDGTALDVLNRHPTAAVAILPLGTENLLARQLGIPRRDGAFVAQMIARGQTRPIDLGQVGAQRFAIMASVGFDSEVLHQTHAARGGSITRWAYVPPVLRTLVRYRFPPVRVYVDDDPRAIVGGLALVANLPEYALQLPLTPGARADDGRLDVAVFPHRSPFQFLRDLGNVVLGRSGGIARFTATRVRIEADVTLPVQADGDPAGSTPVEIRVLPRAARVFVP